MPRSNKQMIKKLQAAINEKFHERILIDRTQFYSDKQERPVTIWKVKKSLPEEQQKKNSRYVELFSTTSQIQIVLFLRDYWYKLNGWDVPTDNQIWEQAKERYRQKNGIALTQNEST